MKKLLTKPNKSKLFINKIDNLFKEERLTEVERMILLYYLPEFKFKTNRVSR